MALSAVIASVVFLGSGAMHARATIVAAYTFSGDSLNSTDADPLSVASALGTGAGLAGSTEFFNVFGSAYGATSDVIPGDATNPGTEAEAISDAAYMSFTVTPNAGEQLAYSDLSFDFAASNESNTTTESISLRSSVDDFGSSLGINSAVIDAGSTEEGADVSLSGLGVQSGPVEFRLYFYDNENNGTFTTEGITSILLNATDIPEPSSGMYALLGAVCCALVARHRKGKAVQCTVSGIDNGPARWAVIDLPRTGTISRQERKRYCGKQKDVCYKRKIGLLERGFRSRFQT